jgi:hypothetical protein
MITMMMTTKMMMNMVINIQTNKMMVRIKSGYLTPGDALMEVLEPRQTIRPSRYSIRLRPLAPSSPPAHNFFILFFIFVIALRH